MFTSYCLLLQKPITNFSFPFAPLIDWFPEADVLKKRETLRQLVLSLQSRLNPDLKYDLQQGNVPPVAVMPETSDSDMSVADAAVLNPVDEGSDANLLKTSLEQADGNKHKLSEESGNLASEPMLSVQDYFPQHIVTDVFKSTLAVTDDAGSMTVQTVAGTTSVTNDSRLDINLPAISEPLICQTLSCQTSGKIGTTLSDGVCQGPSASPCASAMRSTQDTSDQSMFSSVTIFQRSVHERTKNILAADAEDIAFSADSTDASGKPCPADSSLCQVSDAASCVEPNVSRCIVQCVDESLVCSTELSNTCHELSATGSASS